MNLIRRLFSTKEKTEAPVEEAEIIPQPNNQGDRGAHNIVEDAFRYQNILSMLDRLIHPSVVGNNFIEMFKTIPEVFWPIDYIAKH